MAFPNLEQQRSDLQGLYTLVTDEEGCVIRRSGSFWAEACGDPGCMVMRVTGSERQSIELHLSVDQARLLFTVLRQALSAVENASEEGKGA